MIQLILILGLFFLACNDSEEKKATTIITPAIVARGVRVDIALPAGQLILRGATMTFADAGADLKLEGDASISLDGQTGFRAGADRISVAPRAAKVELTGNVKARFNLSSEVGNEDI